MATKNSDTNPTPAPTPTQQPSSGMPGWAKACLVGCSIIVVLALIAGGAIYWFVQNKVLTPENRQIINQAVEVSKKVNPNDAKALSNFMDRLQKGEIKLSSEQQKQADDLAAALESGTLDDATVEKMLTLMKSIDSSTFGDTEHWRAVVKQVLPFFQNLINEGKKMEK